MSFDQALSGLDVASQNLDVIGNNIANANTIGFKSGSAHFSDLFSSALSSSKQAGLGTQVTGISQSFSQGQINATSNPMDVAISGAGFFRMDSADNGITYSRDGEFQMDKNNYIVNSMGYRLTGFPATANGTLQTGAAPVDLQVTQTYQLPAATSKLSLAVNLDSRTPVPANSPFNFNDPTTYNSTTSSTVYDSLGNQHIFSVYYVKTGANAYNIYGSVDNATIQSPAVTAAATATYSSPVNFSITSNGTTTTITGTPSPATGAGAAALIQSFAPPGVTATTNASGQLVLTGASGQPLTLADNTSPSNMSTVLGLTAGTTAPNQATMLGQLDFMTNGLLTTGTTSAMPLSVTAPLSTGATTPMTFSMDMTGTTQFGSAFGVATLNQDGYASGNLTNFDIGSDGTITGHYTNGQTRLLGQVALANFANAQGLQSIGNNQFVATTQSGQALLGAPGTSSLGSLQSSALEESNVDLTTQLVDMIEAQRVYQANAESIKTQDQIMQTITSLQ